MFERGDYIQYGVSGLCRVESITTLDLQGVDRNRLFYRLSPVDSKNETIYTPVDNEKTVMRPALDREKAEQLIEAIPGISVMETEPDKVMEQKYKQAIISADSKAWVQVIKTLYLKKRERGCRGKRISAVEEKYYQTAVRLLYTELARALGLKTDQMEDYIVTVLKEKENIH